MSARNKMHESGAQSDARRARSARRIGSRSSLLAPRLLRRRGVLLLVVLSMLVLFLMVGTAFIIVAKQSESQAKKLNQANQADVNSAARGSLLDDVLMQIIRDTDDPLSSLRGHGLLTDLYGNDGFRARITRVTWAGPPAAAATNPSGGQMLQFELDATFGVFDQYNNPFDPQLYLSKLDEAYAGQVLTFVSAGATSSARGRSTRIVSSTYDATTMTFRFTVLAVPLADGSIIVDPTRLEGTRIVVNGRPFNGTGVGFNQYITDEDDPKLSASEILTGIDASFGAAPIALLPNPIFQTDPSAIYLPFEANAAYQPVWQDYFQLPSNTPPQVALTRNWIGPGGADESYDAPDYQNMLLAFVQEESEDYQTPPAAGNTENTLEDMVLPSLHRPEIVSYWNNRLFNFDQTTLATNARLLRKAVLRPNHLDHPKFTGSNAGYEIALRAFQANPTDATAQALMVAAYTHGPWDVDNDNDGNRDSIWFDAGLPVMMGRHGKLVKPLVSVLCIDMDGRLNVNLAGSLDVANPDSSFDTDGDGVDPSDVPRGVGWGVADISLKSALGDQGFAALLTGRPVGTETPTGGGVAGVLVPGPAGGAQRMLPGRYGLDGEPGRSDWFDTMARVTLHELPGFGRQPARTTYALPPDLKSRYTNAVNQYGQLVVDAASPNEGRSLSEDNPYELLLFADGSDTVNSEQAPDAPFSVAELERVLRSYDTDATALPPRLAALAGVFDPFNPNPGGGGGGPGGPSDAERRNMISTDTWSIPGPAVTLPHEMAALVVGPDPTDPNPLFQKRLPRSTTELFEIRVRAILRRTDNTVPLFPAPLTDQNHVNAVNFILRQILAPELAAGRKLDVNRPLGNGVDDNNNGVVDEPGEDLVYPANQPSWLWGGPAAAGTPAWINNAYANAFFTPLDTNGDGVLDDVRDNNGVTVDGDSKQQRQLLARHLYTLALTLTMPANFPTNSVGEQRMCRRMAQWAINAVDFRDADNIMTPFEYDLNPFDGWNVGGPSGVVIDGDLRTPQDHAGPDGNPGTADDTVVWGSERPEVLMNEMLAWHDRQSYDSVQEDPYPPTDQPGPTDPNDRDFDPDYDQTVRPRGAFFVELYNPWSAQPGAARDTHFFLPNNPSADLGVDLSKVDAATGNSPVWRMVIYKRGQAPPNQRTIPRVALWDPDALPGEEQETGMTRPPVPVDRSVYFTGFDPAERNPQWDDNGDGVAFFMNPATAAPKYVRPGRYMVVGSGEEYRETGVFENPIGDPAPPQGNAPAAGAALIPKRRIELDARDGAIPNRVRMINDDGTTVVTDPVAGYAVQAPADTGADGMPPRLDGDLPGNTSISDVAIIDHVWDVTDNYDDDPTAAMGSRALRRRRLTLSEPARGYIHRFMNAQWSEASQRYRNPDTPLVALDIPLDGPIGGRAVLDARTDDEGNPLYTDDYPIPAYLRDRAYPDGIDEALCTVGEYQNGANQNNNQGNNNNNNNNQNPPEDPRMAYGSVFLQRLTNPLLPWNPAPAPGANPQANGHNPQLAVNPYVTVDAMSSDLTVFNGNARNATDLTSAGFEENKEDPNTNGQGTNTNDSRGTFASLERGFLANGSIRAGRPTSTDDDDVIRLWNIQRPSRRAVPAELAAQGRQFTDELPVVPHNHYAFAPYMQTLRASNRRQVILDVPFCTLGFLNSAFQRQNGPPGFARQTLPDDDRPLTWFPWNNRPFISGNELMLTPRVRPSMMLRQYTTNEQVNEENLYEERVENKDPDTYGEIDDDQEDQTAFTHLENFLYDEEHDDDPDETQPSHLHRLLEYVETPSLMPGARTWLNPGYFSYPVGQAPPVLAAGDPRRNRLPPFNWVSEFREPGRLNLNTLSSPRVYAGLFHAEDPDDVEPDANGEVHPGPRWDENEDSLTRSRRGYGGEDDDILQFDNGSPTFFGNPFRAPNTGDLVPLPNMVRHGIESTLLRSTSVNPNQVDENPLFVADTGDDHNDADRSPFFHFAPMIRLDNLTTRQSNVYAVWITIGYFEVEDIAGLDDQFKQQIASNYGQTSLNSVVADPASKRLYEAVYPDGYTLGKEDGLDEGDVRRMRGFYIIDRSRPVGFEPGNDLNVEKTIRLRRRIE